MLRKVSNSLPTSGEIVRFLPECYVAIALLILGAFCLLTPPFFGADELAHSERALQISHGELVSHHVTTGERVAELLDESQPDGAPLTTRRTTSSYPAYGSRLDTNFLLVGMRSNYLQRRYVAAFPWTHRPDGRMSESQLASLASYRWSRQTIFVNYLNTAVYPPLFYLPAALAWGLGEKLDVTIVHTLYAARVCNALCAVTLGWLALRLAVKVRLFLFVFLLLPAVMAIESSCSQDALLLPVCALMMSMLIRALTSHRLLRHWELAVLVIGLACCIAARPPYLAMIVVLALPALEMRADRLHQWIAPALGAFAVIVLVSFWRLLIRSAELSHSGVAHPELQLAYIKAHAAKVAVILVVNAFKDIPSLVEKGTQFVELGSLPSMAIFHGLNILFLVCILLVAHKVTLRRWQSRLLLLLAFLCVIGVTSLAEYIIWNAPGSGRVDGVQARYYLPFLPFAMFLASRHATNNRKSGTSLTERMQRFLPVTLALFVAWITYTPWLLAHRYYNASPLTSLRNALH